MVHRSLRQLGWAWLIVGAVASCGGGRTTAASPRFGSLGMDYRAFKFDHGIDVRVLPNGMRAALIRDFRTNLITIDMRYAVGAAEDPSDHAGLAHLAEHLMFATQATPGGPTLGDELSDLTLSYNAWTTPDEIDFTSTAPAENLEALIALEARRMQATCAQLDATIFTRERNVVLAEEAQRKTALDGLQRELMATVYGAGHPYARGRGEQIGDVTRDQACAFMTREFTPSRAILVIAGRLDVDLAAAAIERAFGTIGRPGPDAGAAIVAPHFDGQTSEHTAPIEHATALVFLPHPAWGAGGRSAADLAAAHLKAALDQAADDRDWIHASDVATMGGKRAPVLAVAISVEDDAHLGEAVDLVFASATEALRREGDIEERQIAQQRGRGRLRVVAAWDRLDDRGAWVADYLQYTNHHYFMLRDLSELASVTDGGLRGVLDGYQRARAHVALVRPTGDDARADRVEVEAATRTGDLALWRAPMEPGEAQRPLEAHPPSLAARVTTYDLANGLHVILAPDPRSPIVDARVVFPAGTADAPRDRPGLAHAAALLLDHDYAHPYFWRDYDRVKWSHEVGTQLDSDVEATTTTFSATGLSEYGDWHVWALSWLIDQGVYDDDDLAKLRKRVEKADDDDDSATDGSQRLRERLFGVGHPYAAPPWQPKALLAIGRRDLESWKQRHFRPAGATLIISGGFDADAMRAEIDELFAPWRGSPLARATVVAPRPPPGPSWLGVVDDDLVQAQITVAFPATSDAMRDQAARQVLTLVLADRMRLVREGMGASYGVDVRYRFGPSGSALVIGGRIDPARAGEVLVRVLAELDALRAGGAALEPDFVRARRRALDRAQAYAGGASDTADEVEQLVASQVSLDRPAAHAAAIANLTPDNLLQVVAADLAAGHMVVQVAGSEDVVKAAFAAVKVTPEQ